MANSKLNTNVAIDKDNWAVSLICCKGSNHAEIVVEGIGSDGTYFMKMAHFGNKLRGSKQVRKKHIENLEKGSIEMCKWLEFRKTSKGSDMLEDWDKFQKCKDNISIGIMDRIGAFFIRTTGKFYDKTGVSTMGKVEPFKNIQPKNLRYDGAKTWQKPKQRVQGVMNSINKEKTHKFSNVGSHSFLNPTSYINKDAHNCFTWACARLNDMGINVSSKTRTAFLYSATKQVTNPDEFSLTINCGSN